MAQSAPASVDSWQHGTFRPDKLTDLAIWFAEAIRDMQPDIVVYEEPLQVVMLYAKKGLLRSPSGASYVTPNAAQTVLWKLEGMLIGLAAVGALPIVRVPPKTWRAGVLHDGNLDRDRAKVRAQQTCAHLGLKIKSVDEAEACCIAVYGLGTVEFRDAMRRGVDRGAIEH